MKLPGNVASLTAEGVNNWLVSYTSSSSDLTRQLDDLRLARRLLSGGIDPLVIEHKDYLEAWLANYVNQDPADPSGRALPAYIAYGSLVFLSSAYRRQLYVQSRDQADYESRKAMASYPRGIEVLKLFPKILNKSFGLLSFKAEDPKVFNRLMVASAVNEAVKGTNLAINGIQGSGEDEYGQEKSYLLKNIGSEQRSWLFALGEIVTITTLEQSINYPDMPVLSPEPLHRASATTLRQLAMS